MIAINRWKIDLMEDSNCGEEVRKAIEWEKLQVWLQKERKKERKTALKNLKEKIKKEIKKEITTDA